MKKSLFILLTFILLGLGSINATSPVIKLLGDANVTVNVGDTYTDAGATLNDLILITDNIAIIINGDGNLILNLTITKTSDVDMSKIGNYTVTYNAIDSFGNSSTATRTVNVLDKTSPVINIIGDNPASVEIGDTYTDKGATATDNIDGDLTSSITATGSVNTSSLGTYDIIYTVSDLSGNNATATRTVNVIETPVSVPSSSSNNGVSSSSSSGTSASTLTTNSIANNTTPANTNNSTPKTGITGSAILSSPTSRTIASIVIVLIAAAIIAAKIILKKRKMMWGFGKR